MTKGGKKLIKIWVDKDTGEIADVKLGKDDGTDEKDATQGNVGQPNYQYRGTIAFYQESNPGNCIVIMTGGYAWKICW
jgi:hypothetical protein